MFLLLLAVIVFFLAAVAALSENPTEIKKKMCPPHKWKISSYKDKDGRYVLLCSKCFRKPNEIRDLDKS